MFIFLTISLLIFASIAMLVLHLVRPRLSIQGFLVILAMLVGLVLVFIAKSTIPASFTLLKWSPEELFPVTPTLIVDQVSWLFALALMALSITIVITSISQLGWTSKSDSASGQNEFDSAAAESDAPPGSRNIAHPDREMPNWLFWTIVPVITSLGLVAVTSGNLLTLLLAWVALDIIEVAILIGYSLPSEDRERALITFSAKLGSTVMLIVAGLIIWSQGGSLNYAALTPPVSAIAILAVAVRLGVLPPLVPYTHRLPVRQDLATILFLVPASAGYILLARLAFSGTAGAITPFIIGLTLIIGLVSGIQWFYTSNMTSGRRYWMVACASLAIVFALLNQPTACLAWSIASLLSGGLIFSFSIPHRNLIPIMVIGIFNLSMLPFSPTWPAASISISGQGITSSRLVDILFLISLLVIQMSVLAGYIRSLLLGFIHSIEDQPTHIERWVWLLFPLGLIIDVLIHLLLGWFLLPDLSNLPLSAWIIGPITLLVSGLVVYVTFHSDQANYLQRLTNSDISKRLFSNQWLYNVAWKIYRSFTRLTALISTILEGEGGILWALVLFALIFVLLQR